MGCTILHLIFQHRNCHVGLPFLQFLPGWLDHYQSLWPRYNLRKRLALNQGCVERWVFHGLVAPVAFDLIGRLTDLLIKSFWTKKYRFKRQSFIFPIDHVMSKNWRLVTRWKRRSNVVLCYCTSTFPILFYFEFHLNDSGWWLQANESNRDDTTKK